MRRLLFTLGLCLGFFGLSGSGAWAATAKVDHLSFLPVTFHVGEEAEAFALVHIEGGEAQAFAVKAGEGLPSPGPHADPELRSVSIGKGREGWELRIRFVPWSPEASRLPALELRGLSIPSLAYEVSPVLRRGEGEPSPPKAQLDPPGSALYLYGFAGLAIFLAFLVFASAAWLIPSASRLLARRKAAQARRDLGRSLAWLAKEKARARPEDFYAVLARAFRLYLAARILPSAPALTPRELAGLGEDVFPVPGLRDEAAALLAESDAVRYTGLEAGPAMMGEALTRAARLGDAAEEALNDGL